MLRNLMAHGRGAAVALLVVIFALPAPAGSVGAPDAEGAVDVVFDLYFGGIWVGEAVLDADVGADGYTADAKLRTTGIVRAFFDARFTADTRGAIAGDLLQPVRFNAVASDHKKTQHVTIDYEGGAPSGVSAEPPFKKRETSIVATEQGRVPDPLTGALSTLAPRKDGVCNRRVEMFDGQYRFAVNLGVPETSGNEIKCEAIYERIAGYKPKMLKDDRRTVPFTIWFRKRADGLWEGDRVLVPTEYAMIAMKRRD